MEENERNRQITSLNDDPELAQFLEDERFAILLQNEEFVRELRLNQDFMSTLESDNNFNPRYDKTESAILYLNLCEFSVCNVTEHGQASYVDSDAAFKEKLRNMGKVSKRKFTQLARLFSGRVRKNFKHLDESTSRDPYYYEGLNDNHYDDTENRNANLRKHV